MCRRGGRQPIVVLEPRLFNEGPEGLGTRAGPRGVDHAAPRRRERFVNSFDFLPGIPATPLQTRSAINKAPREKNERAPPGWRGFNKSTRGRRPARPGPGGLGLGLALALRTTAPQG